MMDKKTSPPSSDDLLGSPLLFCQHVLAGWRARAKARGAERRLQAELDAMSPRERQEIDITAGNLALSGIAPGAGPRDSAEA